MTNEAVTDTSASNDWLETARNLETTVRAIVRGVQEASAPLVPLLEAARGDLAHLALRVAEATAPLRTPEFAAWVLAAAQRFVEAGKWLENAPEKLRQAFEEAGVAPHPELSFQDLVRVLRAFHEDGNEAAVRELHVVHAALFEDPTFRAQLTTRWTASPRGHLLLQILKAHDAEGYATSVPTALAQAEGVVVDAVAHHGHLGQKTLLRHVSALRGDDTLFGPVVAQFIEKFLFANFTHGDPSPPFSRHAILHGADVSYATKEKSLQALVWLDYLVLLTSQPEGGQE